MNERQPVEQLPRFEIVLPAGMHDSIREFLFTDSSREHMGVILAGACETDGKVKLLGREFVPVQPDEYEHQSGGGLAVNQQFSQRLLQRCRDEGLSQIDVHSHPFGPSPDLWFSGTDDAHERRMAEYIYGRFDHSLYASLVMNQGFSKARIWLPHGHKVRHHEIGTLTLAEFPFRKIPISAADAAPQSPDDMFSRQVLAFGADALEAIMGVSIAVVGAGGQGSAIVDGLVRLGFRDIAVIDPDVAERSNLNRVLNMTDDDAATGASKVAIASRNASAVNPRMNMTAIQGSVFSTLAIEAVKAADIAVVATDNHATRMFVQHLGAQYLIPVVSVGVNIEAANGAVTDVSGEYAIALPGAAGWCLACAHVYSPEIAAIELADATERKRWEHRGYIEGKDVKAPAVCHLNGIVANLALAEIHNLIAPFKEFRSYLAYDMANGELTPYTIERNLNCAVCSHKALLALGDVEPIPDYERPLTLPDVPAIQEAKATAEAAAQDASQGLESQEQ